MNFLPPHKLDAIEKAFKEGRGILEAARLSGVNADTVSRYYRLLSDVDPSQTEGSYPAASNGEYICIEHENDWLVFYVHRDTPEWWRHVATFHTEKRARLYADDCGAWLYIPEPDKDSGHPIPDEVPAPPTLPEPPAITHPERAEIVEPTPKPREAADGEEAVDRAGSVSEIEARQSAPAAEQPGRPRQETAENPVDAGGDGGSLAPLPLRPLTREEREAERERKWDEQAAEFPPRACEVCNVPLARRRGEPPNNFKIRKTCSPEHSAALIARKRDERKPTAEPVEAKPFNGLADQLAPALSTASPSHPEPHVTPPGFRDCPDCLWSGPIRDYRDHRREDHGVS